MAISLIPGAMSALFADAMERRELTLADRYGMMAAILTEELDLEERRALDRLLRSILRGRITY